MVGRSNQLQELMDRYSHAQRGGGSFVVITGDQGIGKTRLVREFSRKLEIEGALVKWHTWEEGGEGESFQPLVGLPRLDEWTAEDAAIPGHLRQADPVYTAAGQAAAPRSWPSFDGAQAPFNVDSASGGVLILENLQWADNQTSLLLAHLARRLENTRLLVVGTFRTGEVSLGHPVAEMITRLERERSLTRLCLQALEKDSVHEMVCSLVPGEVKYGVTEALDIVAEGNPLYLEEIVRQLTQDGTLRESDDGSTWHLVRRPIDVRLPDTLRQLVDGRLHPLGEYSRAILRQAAVIGERFDYELLVATIGHNGRTLLDAIDEATSARIIREDNTDATAYSFVHPLFRKALLDSLGRARQAAVHRAIAVAILRLHGPSPSRLGELALHYCAGAEADDVEVAASFALQAAQDAELRTAFIEAARFYAVGAATLQRLDRCDNRRREFLVRRGAALWNAGEMKEAQLAYQEAAALPREEIVRNPVQGDDSRFDLTAEQAVIKLEEALRRVPTQDGVDRARVLAPYVDQTVKLLPSDAVKWRARLLAAWVAHARTLISRSNSADIDTILDITWPVIAGSRTAMDSFAPQGQDGTDASPPQAAPADGLTARENEVLALLAAGRTSRDISRELSLSVRTVGRHITNIYGKIGARGRADATAYAFQHGIVAH